VTIASCLPCFLFFPLLGLHVKRQVRHLDQHPQSDWIKIYSEDLSDNSSKIVAIMNETSTGPHQEANAFAQSAAHELAFFEEALLARTPGFLPPRRW
jgi:thiaminase